MPQMSPIMWLTLFLIFSLTFILINPMIFFTKNFHLTSSITKSSLKIFNWKW
uniref:ATP synthase complex subunit 8 n=1 Tax=Lachesilla pedicularia TaxID=1897924 RepID=A0A8K1ZFS6_9NEOP|nr:ATP synthase F0 subunit 8 [Lachesilla pedicularia]